MTHRRAPAALALTAALLLGAVGGVSGPPFAGIAGCGAGPHAGPSASPQAAPPPTPPVTAEPAFGPAAIDAAIRGAWQAAGITPAGRVDDAGFLRRAWLDIAGALPPPEQVTAFLADSAPDKRSKAVDALLASPRYAARWTDAWDDVLLGQVRAPVVDRAAFRRWLHAELEANTPWDKLAYNLITAAGRSSVGGRRDGMGGAESDTDADAAAGVNGAVNWLLKYAKSPQDFPATVSRVFLGVQIQCAQCHDHKTEKWTQADFRSFAACFSHVQARPAGDAPDKGVRAIEVSDGPRPHRIRRKAPDREALQAIADTPPRALDGSDLSESDNPRQALAAWIIAPDNPWFSRAIVNRLWARLVGRGFVEPFDDLRPGNAGVLPDLHTRLARDFAAHGYDLKHLIRTIAATEVYQLAAAPAQAAQGAQGSAGPQAAAPIDALWARFRVRPLPPDVLLDAILGATGMGPVIERVAGDRRDKLLAQLHTGFGFLFDVDEEPADSDYEGTVPQALLLLNGVVGAAGASAAIPGTALAELLSSGEQDAQLIEALYLRTLSRRPSPAEVERWTRFVNEPRDVARTDPPEGGKARRGAGKLGRADLPPRISKRLYAHPGTAKEQAYEDVLWALLNSSEFFFNH